MRRLASSAQEKRKDGAGERDGEDEVGGRER
jgi:hypothetical protein